MTHIEIARSFAENGYHVFPLYRGKNNTKLKPYGWAKNTVVEPEKLSKVIPASKIPGEIDRWPELVARLYNSEVVGFGILGIDCIILDIDVKDGKRGLDEFKNMIKLHNIPKPSMITVTKSGGIHAFYQRPKELSEAFIKTLAGITVKEKKFPAIDLRGDGGFVVGPNEIVESFDTKKPGFYAIKKIVPIEQLPVFPFHVASEWVKITQVNDLENLTSLESDDCKTQIRRGIIPEFIPKGARNECFFIFANVLKSKAVPENVARQMMLIMATKVEEPETFDESVNIEDILSRVYIIHKESPYDVAVDLLDRGLFQLTNYKPKLHYCILEPNPYISSKSPHDESSMRVLLAKFQKKMQLENGKTKLINPMDIIPTIIHDEHRVDSLGFKPMAGQVFQLHDDPGSRRFLNTYRATMIPHKEDPMSHVLWSEFTTLISRIFGVEGTTEYQLGLDFVSWLVQKPHIKPSIAPFIISDRRGVGKSLFFNLIARILGTSKDGEMQGRMVKVDEISGRFFNPTGCIVNLIDEVQFPVHRDMRKEAVNFWRHLKSLITAETISMEIKGGSTYQVPNASAIMLAGNSGCNFPIEEFDRRLWIIDNNPPLLERGICDNLFDIVKQHAIGWDERQLLLAGLRYKLANHKIQLELDVMRAPMSAIKKEMYLNSLTDLEEWFIEYFENTENPLCDTPVISKGCFMYILNVFGSMRSPKWAENPDGIFRDLRRRGYIRPIRMKSDQNVSRQFNYIDISPDGKLFTNRKKELLYTTRNHGDFDKTDTSEVVQIFTRNLNSIERCKTQMKQNAIEAIKSDTLAMQ